MVIIKAPIPDWFFQSKVFEIETNSTHKDYNSPKNRILDYSSFPVFSCPSNKVALTAEEDYSLLKSQENENQRVSPYEKVGFTHFPKLTGRYEGQNIEFYNKYPPSKQAAFRTEGGTLASNTLNLGAGTNEAIQWINGEMGIGYNISFGDTESINRMNNFTNSCRSYQPNSKFGIYSLQAFPIWEGVYNAKDSLEGADLLYNVLVNPPDSIQALCGFDYLIEDVYSLNSTQTQFYGALSLLLKQIARKKFLLTNNPCYSKVYYIIWSHSENFGYQLRYRKNTGQMITSGELWGLVKAPANPNHNYNVALLGVTCADGISHFVDRLPSHGQVNINGSLRDLEIENIDGENGGIDVILRGQNYPVAPAIIWYGVNQYTALAIWQAWNWRDIIEDTTYDWFTPDFIYKGVTRTDKYKTIPYNLFYKEPTFEVKYSSTKDSCLIYACNFSATNYTSPEHVYVKVKNKFNQEVQIPLILKGSKAELFRVNF